MYFSSDIGRERCYAWQAGIWKTENYFSFVGFIESFAKCALCEKTLIQLHRIFLSLFLLRLKMVLQKARPIVYLYYKSSIHNSETNMKFFSLECCSPDHESRLDPLCLSNAWSDLVPSAFNHLFYLFYLVVVFFRCRLFVKIEFSQKLGLLQ